jgi:predicted anti-sigma-YlaC factor YlaD
MDCRQAESWLALWVGNDLSDTEPARQLQVHLEQCEHCRAKSLEFVVAHTALQEARCVPAETPVCLWPRVRARLAQWDCRPQFARFNVWVPTALATVACSLLVWVATVEVQRKVQQWPQVQNLHQPAMSLQARRSPSVSPRDFERWRELERQPVRFASGPPRSLFDE